MHFHPSDFMGSFYYNAQYKHDSILSVNTPGVNGLGLNVRERSFIVASTSLRSKLGHP